MRLIFTNALGRPTFRPKRDSERIWKTAGKKLYRIVYRRPDNTQTQERGFARKRDAEIRLAEVEVSKAKGDYVNPADAQVTVSAIATTWLSGR